MVRDSASRRQGKGNGESVGGGRTGVPLTASNERKTASV